MIIKSRVTGKNVLEVLENFRMDVTLPKFARPKQETTNHSNYNGAVKMSSMSGMAGFGIEPSDDGVSESWDIATTPMFFNTAQSINGDSKTAYSIGWKRRLVKRLEKMLKLNREEKRIYGKVSPIDIFLSARGSLQEIKDYIDRVKIYDAVIKDAMLAGQIGRADQLKKARKIVQQESVLRAAGFKTFLSEETVIDFAIKCEKGLRLDWVANFNRPVPAEVLAKKVEADAVKMFDNYAILHYDPSQSAFVLTPAEVQKRKDPILFGLLENSRKLYFIGDWKDDVCQLTMEEVARVLGHPAGEIPEDPTAI